VNIIDFMRTVNLVDAVIAVLLFGAFVLGFLQGAIRRLVGILTILFSFYLAAQLQVQIGGFLAENWRQFPPRYPEMIGFLTVFVAAVVAFALVVQGAYSRVHVFAKYPVVDEILGGILGVVEGGLLLLFLTMILDQYFLASTPGAQASELPVLREAWSAVNGSGTGAILHNTLIPGLVTVTGLLLPIGVRATYGKG
jgi:uncharacterized membrane protein required for colicin V production